MAETLKEDSITIREVWNDNLLEEFALIREIVDKFTYVAMDTEFPGVARFGELMMSSGIVLNDSISWVTFHGGYDFGYLVKLLTCKELPVKQADFFKLLYVYFPTVYDIKHLMTFCNGLFGGLNRLAELMGVERVGVCHQAGSDSLLTLGSFRKLKERYFPGSTERYTGVLYGLGVEDDGTNVAN